VPVVTDVSHNTEGEIHLPAGQHLLVDIQKVDYDFLASEERLATAMLDVVGECGLTLLSYHCHGLYPAGVSCVGVLLESHVSFHTWPAEGVITLDLFTCGANSLLPIVPTVERLFSVPRAGVTDLMDMPETIWAYKLRGFGEDTEESKAALTDLFTFPIGAMTEYKKEVWHYLVPGCHSCFWTLDPHRANRPPDRIILSFESADRYLRCPSIAVSDFDVL
jgi:S-adenosylmethionine decarboxylase proenzyme